MLIGLYYTHDRIAVYI